MTTYRLKRIYDDPAADDGYRVLVDRVWPRGIRKQDAQLAEWCREVAPSTELRGWFGHEPARYQEFARRYREELAASGEAAALAERVRDQQVVTLLIGARDFEHNQGQVLLEVLTGA